MATTLIVGGAAVGLAYLAGQMLKPDDPQAVSDDRPTTLALRGVYVPLLQGRRKLAPIVAWAGDREAEEQDSGGKGFGASGGGGTLYYESAWHVLCVGPAQRLWRIWQNGKVIWSGPISADTTPSGSEIVLDNDEGTLAIYWGEPDQPINEFLADASRAGVASRWKYHCYIQWTRKTLGSSPQWPNLEYELETEGAGDPVLFYDDFSTYDPDYPYTDQTVDMVANFYYQSGSEQYRVKRITIPSSDYDEWGNYPIADYFPIFQSGSDSISAEVYSYDPADYDPYHQAPAMERACWSQLGVGWAFGLPKITYPVPHTIPAVLIQSIPALPQNYRFCVGVIDMGSWVALTAGVPTGSPSIDGAVTAQFVVCDGAYSGTDHAFDSASPYADQYYIHHIRLYQGSTLIGQADLPWGKYLQGDSSGSSANFPMEFELRIEGTTASCWINGTKELEVTCTHPAGNGVAIAQGSEIGYKFFEVTALGGAAPAYSCPLVQSSHYLPESEAGRGDSGINAAHALWQICTAAYPHGVGLDPAHLDGGSFEALGVLCERERLLVNALADEGQTASEKLAELLTEVGFALPQVGSKLVALPLRYADPATLPVLDESVLCPPRLEITRVLGDNAPDRIEYTFKNIRHGYRDDPVAHRNDALAITRRRSKTSKVAIHNFTSRSIVEGLVKRLTACETAQGESIAFTAARGARSLWPGQQFLVNGRGGYVVTSRQLSTASAECEIEAMADPFDATPDAYSPIAEDAGSTLILPPAADLFVAAYQVPASVSATPAIQIARIRAHSQITRAQLWISEDGVTYSLVGTASAVAAGGTLQSGILATDGTGTPLVIASGPVLTALNSDLLSTWDLTSRITEWQAGVQIALIDGECFFLQRLTAVEAGYQLEGLIRAQYGTTAADHALGATAVIARPAKLKLFTHPLIRSGATVYLKVRPGTAGGWVSMTDLTALTLAIA